MLRPAYQYYRRNQQPVRNRKPSIQLPHPDGLLLSYSRIWPFSLWQQRHLAFSAHQATASDQWLPCRAFTDRETRVKKGLIVFAGGVQILRQRKQTGAIEVGQFCLDVAPRWSLIF